MESLKSELEKSRAAQIGQKYIDLEAEKEKLYEQLKKEIHLKDQESTDLTQVNQDLVNYVEFLEKRETLKWRKNSMSLELNNREENSGFVNPLILNWIK